MRNTKSTKKKKALILVAVILIVAVAFIVSFLMWRQEKEEKEKISKGIAYLNSLEKQDISAIGEKIDAIKATQGGQFAEADENAVWSGFDSAVILGDSRAVGFRYFEFLLDDQVIAESGRKITDVPNEMEKLKTISPIQIFLCFGLNDIKSGIWPEPVDYANAYREIITFLNQELPGTIVYINSILPATGQGLEDYEGYARIGDYNAALKKMAEENGYQFIDNTMVAQEHADLYEADGLHLKKEFYKYWAANMLTGGREQ